jgi:hypothetical protein
MSNYNSPLDSIRIASPCQANWNEMFGNDRKRFCAECKLNVYNLSEMTKAQAESFVQNAEGRVCVRLYRRADGTVLTQDCPVGWAKIKQRTRAVATAVFSLIVSLFSGLLLVSLFARQQKITEVGVLRPISTPTPRATPDPKYPPMMGAVALPSPTPKAQPSATPKPEGMLMGKIAVKPAEIKQS